MPRLQLLFLVLALGVGANVGCKGSDGGAAQGGAAGTGSGVGALTAGVGGGAGVVATTAGSGAGVGAQAGQDASMGTGTMMDAAVSMAGTGGAAGTGGPLMIPSSCPAPAPNQPPETLTCTGLYSDIAAKTLSQGVAEFAPAVMLWSDGADKTRWIYLPPGQKIDVSNPDAWKFPLDTRFWKEFKVSGKRVETRMFWKVSQTFWARTAYKWSADESEATRTGGEDITAGGGAYHIPSTTECDQCHKGRVDRALGFEAILLGLPGATGMNAAALQAQGLISGGSLPASVAIGDDGTGKGSDALGWLHVNCGVSCHNDNSASEGYTTGMRLNLKVADTSGGSTAQVFARMTTLGINATTARWSGQVRIVPGNPDSSLLYSLMSTRNPGAMKDQMPPIASRVVPSAAATLIHDWIAGM